MRDILLYYDIHNGSLSTVSRRDSARGMVHVLLYRQRQIKIDDQRYLVQIVHRSAQTVDDDQDLLQTCADVGRCRSRGSELRHCRLSRLRSHLWSQRKCFDAACSEFEADCFYSVHG